MAGLLSKEADAIRKAIKVDNAPDLAEKIRSIQADLKGELNKTSRRAQETERILERDVYVDGTEVAVKGRLFHNMVEGLDEAGLKSVLALLEIRRTDVIAQYDEHVAALEKAWHPRTNVLFKAPVLSKFTPS